MALELPSSLPPSPPCLHPQVIKLRAEDQHLAQDLLDALQLPLAPLPPHLKDVFVASPRPSFPSPLGLGAANHGIPVWDSVQ